MSDRGYRDEVGAAVERLEKLAEENAQLRAELDRLDEPKRALARRRSTGVGLLLLGVTFAMGVGAFSHGFSCPHRAHGHRGHSGHSVASQRTQRALDVRTRADQFGVIQNGNDCTLPYYFDSNNVRRLKPSCIEAVAGSPLE